MQDPEELVLSGGLVKVGCLFVDKERVRHPDQLYVLCPHHQLLEPALPLEGEPRVAPELPEVHVQREVLQVRRESYD